MNNHAQVVLGVALSGAMLAAFWTQAALSDRLAMARAHAHFTEAMRDAMQNISDAQVQGGSAFTAEGIPTSSEQPTNTTAWISHFSRRVATAPGGGPAYVVNRWGNDLTGTIGVSATQYGSEVQLTRPMYLGLKPQQVKITATDVSYSPPLLD